MIFFINNLFYYDFFRQSLAVMAPTLLFSIMSGVVTFSLLGYLSLKAGVPLNDIVSSGEMGCERKMGGMDGMDGWDGWDGWVGWVCGWMGWMGGWVE